MKKLNYQKGVSNAALIILVVILAVAVFVFWFYGGKIMTAISPQTQTQAPQQSAPLPNKTFTIASGNYEFLPKKIRAREGDRVRINFASVEGTHSWALDEFNVKTRDVGAGQATILEFIAKSSGTFEYYSSTGDDRDRGMVGQLVVEQK